MHGIPPTLHITKYRHPWPINVSYLFPPGLTDVEYNLPRCTSKSLPEPVSHHLVKIEGNKMVVGTATSNALLQMIIWGVNGPGARLQNKWIAVQLVQVWRLRKVVLGFHEWRREWRNWQYYRMGNLLYAPDGFDHGSCWRDINQAGLIAGRDIKSWSAQKQLLDPHRYL